MRGCPAPAEYPIGGHLPVLWTIIELVCASESRNPDRHVHVYRGSISDGHFARVWPGGSGPAGSPSATLAKWAKGSLFTNIGEILTIYRNGLFGNLYFAYSFPVRICGGKAYGR
jgi:hypothetical protein